MKLVIDIDKELYHRICKDSIYDNGYEPYETIRNGTSLSDVIDDIKSEIEIKASLSCFDDWGNETAEWSAMREILDKHISGEGEKE